MELTFKHRGKLGDILYSLCFVKSMGGGKLYLQLNGWLDQKGFDFLKPLILAQSYITDVELWNGQQIDYDLDRFREIMNTSHQRSLVESYFVIFNKTPPINFQTEPWIEVLEELHKDSIIVSRVPSGLHGSREVYNPSYINLLKETTNKCFFVGLIEEWHNFIQTFELDIEYRYVENALELAQLIKGADYCVMNQSMPVVIAESMKKKLFLELRHDVAKPDCMFDRPNLIYI